MIAAALAGRRPVRRLRSTRERVSDTLALLPLVVAAGPRITTLDQCTSVVARRRRSLAALLLLRPAAATRSPCRRSCSRYFVLRRRSVENGRTAASSRPPPARCSAGIRDAAPRLDRPARRPRRRRLVPLRLAGDDTFTALERTSSSTAAFGPVYDVDGPTPRTALPETPVRSTAPTARSSTATGALRRVTLRGLVQLDIAGRSLARDPDDRARRSIASTGRSVVLTRVRGLYPRHLVGPDASRTRASAATAADCSCASASDTQLFDGDQVVTATRDGRVVACRRSQPPSSRSIAAARRRARRVHRALHGRADCASRRACSRAATDTRVARRPLPRLRLPPMRIAFDVSPLSHERTGVNNYIRGSLARARRGRAERGDEVVAFAPTSPAGQARRSREALAGIDVELRLVRAAGRARLAHRVVASPAGRPPSAGSARSTRCTSATGCTRRSAPACARRRSTTSCRSTIPSGRRGARARCTAASTATPRAPATSSSRTRPSPPTTSRATLGVPARAGARRAPGHRRRVHAPTGERADLGVPYLLTVATLEPRKNLGTLVEAFALLADTGLVARRRGRRRLGRAAAARPARHRPARARHRRRAGAALPRRGGRRLPVALRGLRDADHRGDGVAARRSSPRRIRRWTRRRATRRCAPTPRARGDRGRDPRGARAPRRAARARARARARGSRGGATGEIFLEGYERFA